MGCVGVIPDLILNRSFSLSLFISGCTLQRICPVCVEHKDDFIIILCHLHQSVIEAATQITDCHYSRCSFAWLLHKNHAIHQCYLPTSCLNQKEAIGNYEFTLTPRALFAPDGTFLPCLDKSKLIHLLEKTCPLKTSLKLDVQATKIPTDTGFADHTSDQPSRKLALVDGMVLVQKLSKKTNSDCSDSP